MMISIDTANSIACNAIARCYVSGPITQDRLLHHMDEQIGHLDLALPREIPSDVIARSKDRFYDALGAWIRANATQRTI